MNWNKYQENILQKWSSMSKTYSIMHSISSEYYSRWDKRLGIPVILLGSAAASSIFTTSSDSSNIWSYINGGMVLLMTGISGISKFIGTNEKQAKHTSASFKYTEISMNIDTLLSFPRCDREEKPRQFINDIKLAILQVRENSPDLPTWVVSEYIKKLDKSLTNTHTKVNRNKGLNSIELPNEWNNIAFKNSTSDITPSTTPPITEQQNITENYNLTSEKKVKFKDIENQSNKESNNIYNDFLISVNNMTEKIECISTKLEYHNSEIESECESEEE